MFDFLKKLTAGEAPENVTTLTRVVEELEAATGDAEQKATTQRAEHNACLLAQVAAGDAATATRARNRLANADADAAELRSALDAARKRLERVQEVAAAATLAGRWDKATVLLDQRIEAAKELQEAQDHVASKFAAYVSLTEQSTAALPQRPQDSYTFLTKKRLADAAMTYLAVQSQEAIGAPLAMSLYQARKLPDLVTQARQHKAILLKARTRSDEAA